MSGRSRYIYARDKIHKASKYSNIYAVVLKQNLFTQKKLFFNKIKSQQQEIIFWEFSARKLWLALVGIENIYRDRKTGPNVDFCVFIDVFIKQTIAAALWLHGELFVKRFRLNYLDKKIPKEANRKRNQTVNKNAGNVSKFCGERR